MEDIDIKTSDVTKTCVDVDTKTKDIPKPYMRSLSLHDLYCVYEKDKTQIQNVITKFYGWIRRIRIGDKGELIFIDVYDGTKVGALMCLASKDTYQSNDNCKSIFPDDELTDSDLFQTLDFGQLSNSTYLSPGCSVVLDGELVLSPKKATQAFELKVYRLRLIGNVDNPLTYPIQKSVEKQLVLLRKHPFTRIRSQISQCLFRISDEAEFGIHMFMKLNNVRKVDPNIITMSDCEGAGETFKVSPLIFTNDSEGKNVPVGLTVSSQLPLESSITGFKQVYTAQKSFRAEKSDTPKHLAEFMHIEYEAAFITLEKLIDFTEGFVKYVIKYTIDKCKEDYDFIESQFAPTDIRPTRELLTELTNHPFVRIKHCDAIDLIQKIVREKTLLPDDNGKLKRVKLDKLPKRGDDLGSEHEKLLVKYFGWIMLSEDQRKLKLSKKKEFGAFVFVTHWPLSIKSFYMKQCDNKDNESEFESESKSESKSGLESELNHECESFDLLAPRVGELFGGSMREWRFEKLQKEVARRKMDIGPIEWFLNLRRLGSMPHGGWGLGFARLCMLLTGTSSVRDVVYLPVHYGHCPY
jgi:asparaginyl-tRNA synthetase